MALETKRQTLEVETLIGAQYSQVLVRAETLVPGAGREAIEPLLAEANPELQTIRKTRYRVPHEGQVAEFDRYPFWSDRMILEIELDSEAEAARVPDWVEVIRDVTADPRYKNVHLAAQVPLDEI